jgi:hypothetical protein
MDKLTDERLEELIALYKSAGRHEALSMAMELREYRNAKEK